MKGQRLELRLSPDDLAVLDERRGRLSRSEWLRRAIHQNVPADPLPVRADGADPGRQTGSSGSTTAAVTARTGSAGTKTERHLHRYVRGEVVRHHKGTPVHAYACPCGATKTE